MKKIYSTIAVLAIITTGIGTIWQSSFADEGINLLKRIQWVFWEKHENDTFSTTGNAGTITLLNSTEEGNTSSSGLYLVASGNTLSGSFFLQTVGYVNTIEGYPVTLTPPGWDSNNIINPWLVSGSVWSDNAWWITLNALDSSYSGVYYLPTSQGLSGFGWSDTLGFLSFNSGAELDFLGKVKILGAIAGDKSFDLSSSLGASYALGWKINTNVFNTFLNNVRKQVALVTRSVPDSKINISNVYGWASNVKKLNSDIVYFKIGTADLWKYVTIDNGSNDIFRETNTRSLIIEWANLYINGDVSDNPLLNKSRAIIVIKDKNGKGGDVYINGSVKKIYASLIAEGSVYSGYPTSAPLVLPMMTSLYNDSKSKVSNLPANQLYIFWTMSSRNTIGGSAEIETGGNGSCPYLETNCNRETAIKYDLNYFRSYDKDPLRRAFKNDSLDNYSVIIESDPRMIKDAPPGLKL